MLCGGGGEVLRRFKAFGCGFKLCCRSFEERTLIFLLQHFTRRFLPTGVGDSSSARATAHGTPVVRLRGDGIVVLFRDI